MAGYYKYIRRRHTARDAVAKSLASSGLLANVNAIARDLAASRLAADSGDVEAMKEANANIERLKAALDELATGGEVGGVKFNPVTGEYEPV